MSYSFITFRMIPTDCAATVRSWVPSIRLLRLPMLERREP